MIGKLSDLDLINLDLNRELVEEIETVLNQERLSPAAALKLYQKGSIGLLGALANRIRRTKHGDKTYFNRNFHIEPTNVCIYSCSFCSYSRLIKKREEGWEYSMEEMMDIVRSYDGQAVTEVHIVGGVLPQYDLPFYETLFRAIKAHRPALHIKALTPVEFHYIFKKAKVTYAEGLKRLADAGLDSVPGGGAEIFDEKLREQIAGGKCSSAQWLELHELWHQMGKRSNATILYGHMESLEQRIDHFTRLRDLQDRTGGFQTFIPLKFRNQGNEMSHIPEVSIIEDMKMYAMSRIYLDNFEHIKAYWPMIGRSTAQLLLHFGVDDLDGTINDTTKIYSMAGAQEQNPDLSTSQICKLIEDVDLRPIERDTLYHVIRDYKAHPLAEEEKNEGFISLPVLN